MLRTILQELVGDVRARYISCLTSRKWAARIITRKRDIIARERNERSRSLAIMIAFPRDREKLTDVPSGAP